MFQVINEASIQHCMGERVVRACSVSFFVNVPVLMIAIRGAFLKTPKLFVKAFCKNTDQSFYMSPKIRNIRA